jgi:RNA polymerase-interacting CarD/CdnL/TRCF family regulator
VILSVGKKVVYPSQGPCRIDRIVKKEINGKAVMLYQLALLDDSGSELFIPVDKPSMGIRMLLHKSEVPKILDCLKKQAASADSWKQRAIDNSKLLASGSAFDLAEIVGSLTDLKRRKGLSAAEIRTLEKAWRLLVCEIAEVTGQTRTTTEEQLEKALETAGRA